MFGKMLSLGLDLATLPARLTWRSAKAATMSSPDFNHFMDELRHTSDEVFREFQQVLAGVDAEMSNKTAHLDPQQKQQAAALAVDAAEKHMSMAAVNMLRALWLSANSREQLAREQEQEQYKHDDSVIIDQES
jgi:hypothetical protein